MSEVDIFKVGGMLGLLKNKIRLSIMLILEEKGEAYFKQIYEELLKKGISVKPTLLAYHLEVLVTAGFVKNRYVRTRDGYSIYSLSEAGRKALEILKKAEEAMREQKQIR